MLSKLKTALHALLRRSQAENDLDEELRYHLEQQTEQNIRLGMNPEEARAAAQKAFGGVEQAKERSRDARGMRWIEDLWQDLRYGARMLMKKPGFTLIAVITLSLGIGANTAIFSVVNAVLLSPAPYHEADRLVMVWEDASFIGFPMGTPAPANFADWRAQNQVFEAMAAIDNRSFNLTGGSAPEKLEANGVTANFFPLLGAKPVLGRSILPSDDQPGARKVAIISHRLWWNRYGADHSVIDRDIFLNGEKYLVIGVMPAEFQFLDQKIDLWVPIAFSPAELAARDNHYLNVIARLRENVTKEQANADIRTIMARIARDYPKETVDGKLSAVAQPLRERLAGDVRNPLLTLLVAVGFVLLIACANISGLLLARGLARSKEMALRAALGAGRKRIARQLLTESLLLAGAGGALGVLLAVWSFAFLKQLVPAPLALSTNLELSMAALLFTLASSVLAGLAFGTAPAIQAARTDLNEALKQSGIGASFGAPHHRLRNLFVIGEIALALILLAGAGLMMRTLYKLRHQYSGMKPESVLIVRTDLPEQKYGDRARRIAFYDRVLEQSRHVPGVISAGYTTAVPLAWKGGVIGFTVEGRQDSDVAKDALYRQVSADYLQTIGITLREGRYFSEHDNQQSTPVAIINETMARKYWPGESAVNKRFKSGLADSRRPWITVIGVVGDVRQMGVDAPVRAEVYAPYQQAENLFAYAPRDLVVRASVELASLVAPLRQAVESVDPDQPVSNVMTMVELLGEETATRRVGMTLLTVFALLALILAGLGVYGTHSYFVVQRTQEIGVRLALGAQPRAVLMLTLWQGMRLTLIGIAVGLAGASALTRLMKELLFEVGATDPITFIGVAALLAFVALLACYLPARRAMKVDPLVALKTE
jgi:putative ABC transport system permease protein